MYHNILLFRKSVSKKCNLNSYTIEISQFWILEFLCIWFTHVIEQMVRDFCCILQVFPRMEKKFSLGTFGQQGKNSR